MRLNDKHILVAGGGGSIGSELVRQLSARNRVMVLDIDETSAFDLAESLQLEKRDVSCEIGDIRDRQFVRNVMARFEPEVVINAAARKHVKPMEHNPMEAIEVNLVGLNNLLDASRAFEVQKFCQISTDKAVNPKCVMGATKLLGEMMVRRMGAGYVCVRFGNVMGSRGSVIPFWQSQLDRGRPITVTDARMTRYMMSIDEACSLVIKAIEDSRGGETYCLDMGEKVNILELAKGVLAKAGRGEIRMIGRREGESLTEELMTGEEKARAKKKGDFWVI